MNIPLQGRIIAIVDVYAALTTERPYKKAYTHEEAARIIAQGKGTHFDPVLVDLFLSASDQFQKISSPGIGVSP
jgi:putative two-component system response regulator